MPGSRLGQNTEPQLYQLYPASFLTTTTLQRFTYHFAHFDTVQVINRAFDKGNHRPCVCTAITG